MDETRFHAQRPGRGAHTNEAPTRFNLPAREADGDWLDDRQEIDGEAPKLRTTVTVERPKSIISRNASPDIPFDRSINAYRGCEQPHNLCVMQKYADFFGFWVLQRPNFFGDQT